MGCDIHGVFEAKEKKTGRWIPFRAAQWSRAYDWFAIVASVRAPSPLFESNRGIPEDASTLWKDECERWGEDFHSHTWLTPAELRQANDYFMLGKEHEPTPHPQEEMKEILVTLGFPEPKTVHWCGTLRDFIGINADFEKCIRYVIAFDN
jgi:hypothetical protein